jgi:uncharacterized protein YcbK (DUF882 family)
LGLRWEFKWETLEQSRQATNLTYEIASGCRCNQHNNDVGGSLNSAHLRGKAADIKCIASFMRYRMVSDLIKRFRRIEVRDSWIHVDIDSTLPQDVLFLK